jgi:hypothetical protein
MSLQRIGGFAFLAGLIISIIFALIPGLDVANWVPFVLLILGIVVGLLNIEDKDIGLFLIASIVLIATSATPLNTLPIIGNLLNKVVLNFVTFVSPAALIVSIVAIIKIANSK